MAALNINNGAGGKGVLELRLFDFDGTVGPVLASSLWFDGFSLSEDGSFLAYLDTQSTRLVLVALRSGVSTSVYQAKVSGSLSWMGWAR